MLIDLHAHSSGISDCCKASGADILAAAKAVGIDGLCLCNHYYVKYLERRGESAAEFAKSYLTEYNAVKSLADKAGMRLFFGIEVSPEPHPNVHLLVYGVEQDFVLQHPEMYHYTQAELYAVVHQNGGYLVQAHPMRKGKNVLLDPKYLDGVEISSHLLYDGTHYAELATYAKQNGLLLTSGGDYHADTPRSRCGVYLPEDLTSSHAVMKHLCDTDSIRLVCQESADEPSREEVFIK
jgi:hypothetical protein